jgi:hypothetical protein
LRDGLIQCLAMVSTSIATAPSGGAKPVAYAPTPPAPTPFVDAIERHMGSASETVDTEKELKLALGLLLKHRGGPGFGHGRLQGRELALLEQKLKSAAVALSEEVSV